MGKCVNRNTQTDRAEQLPDFLFDRVDHYYNDRVKKLWDGRRALMGTPKPGDVCLYNNDYLSIANHPMITQAQLASLNEFGNGPMMSSVFFTEASPQAQFEKQMADFIGMEASMVCQSGWCANTGLLQSLANENTVVYIDMLAHMSLWEGITSARAIAKPFRHNNPEHLERLIKQHGRGIVVVDSVYSTNGSVCPLADIVAVAKQHECIIVVDESHSLGTHGPNGAGMAAELGLTDSVDICTSSLAKTFAGRGGVITGSKYIVQYIQHQAHPMIFSSAVLPTDLAAFNAALEVIREDEWRREKMRENAEYLRHGLTEIGYNISDSASQIISLEPGPEALTLQVRDALEAEGVFGAIFFPPATPKNRTLLRLCANAKLTRDDLDRTVIACAKIRDQVGMKDWASTKRLHR